MDPIFRRLKKILVYLLSLILVVATIPEDGARSQTPAPQAAPSYSGQGAPETAAELQNLVSPIALYPDALVAQVLGAATFPDQVAAANDWMQQNKAVTGSSLMTAVNGQAWDPSVKALTQFPSVFSNMAQNLAWTSELGEAYHNQQADVMTAIQTLRAQAYAVGNLKSCSQIVVVQQSPQTIVIQPANPQVVYVPAYNPAVVYGTPYSPPGYSTAAVVATGVLSFGAGIAVGAMMSGGCCGWGYSSWNCNWNGGGAYYHGGAYYGNTAWHGGYYGSTASAYGAYGSAHYSQGYNPSTGTYARGGSVSTPYGTTGAAQAYNPNTGAYGATHQTSNAYGSYGSSVYSKNGNTAYTQHQTTANGSVGTMQTSAGGKGVAASGAYGNNGAMGESANGNKYATANGTAYKNTGSGWEKNSNGSWNSVQKPSSSSDAAHGWGSSGSSAESHSGGSSAWGSHSGGGSSGWDSRAASSRGWASRGGGGGWGGRR
jgi:Protein of unknown function (DUF3300)